MLIAISSLFIYETSSLSLTAHKQSVCRQTLILSVSTAFDANRTENFAHLTFFMCNVRADFMVNETAYFGVLFYSLYNLLSSPSQPTLLLLLSFPHLWISISIWAWRFFTSIFRLQCLLFRFRLIRLTISLLVAATKQRNVTYICRAIT